MLQIILIGNYGPDKQESMERFAQMLCTGFERYGIRTTLWRPTVFFGKLSSSTISGMGKWLGYLDKWLIFPLVIYWRRMFLPHQKQTIFHVCDHSNAFYLRQLPAHNSGITCHDVLAIRGAFGYADAYCPASRTGKIMQTWILGNLVRAEKIAAVSALTLNQLAALAPAGAKKDWRVIHNAMNANFQPAAGASADALLLRAGLKPGTPFILHTGSRLARKNRPMLLEMAALLQDEWSGTICYAGQPVDAALAQRAQALEIAHRVVSVIKPDHATLTALYSAAAAFVFPSFSEGFGWPVIEAQACGTPVIASNIEPMPEVSGGAALHADPHDPASFSNAFRLLNDPAVRDRLIRDGKANAGRFTDAVMIRAYLDLYQISGYAD